MPTYLALHYWAGSGRAYEPLQAALPAGTRLLAPDLPGYGAQPAPVGFDYSVRSCADWLAGYIAEQQLADYSLIGHSMGGKFCPGFGGPAARRPARPAAAFAPRRPVPSP